MIAAAFSLCFFLHQVLSSALGVQAGFAWDAFTRAYIGLLPTPALAVLYYATLAMLYALYIRLMHLSEAPKIRRSQVVLWGLLLGFLCAVPPSRSTDAFAYLAHGHNAGSDLSQTYAKPIYADDSAYLAELKNRSGLVAHGPSPYGPWWSYLEAASVRIFPADVYGGMLLLKILGTLAFLASAWVAGRLRGGGETLILFNPYLLTELMAEGHNDVWLVLFCLLLAWALSANRIGWAVIAGTAGVLTKYVPALLAGPALAYAWRKRLKPGSMILGLGLSAALCSISFYPFWLGAETFRGVQDNADALPALLKGFKNFFRDNPAIRSGVLKALWLAFIAFWATTSARVKSFEDLVAAGALILLAYFLFFPPFVWAWYLAVPVALLLMLPGLSYRWTVSLSIIGSLQGPLWAWKRAGILSEQGGAFLHHAALPGLGIVWFAAFILSNKGTFTRRAPN